MIVEIILGTFVLIETYVIWNLMTKVEKFETWIQNIENEVKQVQSEITEIDDKGYFESDDEVGEKFNQISQVIKNIQMNCY